MVIVPLLNLPYETFMTKLSHHDPKKANPGNLTIHDIFLLAISYDYVAFQVFDDVLDSP